MTRPHSSHRSRGVVCAIAIDPTPGFRSHTKNRLIRYGKLSVGIRYSFFYIGGVTIMHWCVNSTFERKSFDNSGVLLSSEQLEAASYSHGLPSITYYVFI